ncbi:MAG: phosphoribosyl-ATP diphosphatase [SAR324 cluster bacterium]|nr:phosphoribosyl-ATP diphosphatase [SAR324 cluster bacterium]
MNQLSIFPLGPIWSMSSPRQQPVTPDGQVTLEQVYDRIAARMDADPEHSYVAALNRKGEDAILKKIGEESSELLIAAKNGRKPEAIHELADLLFHLLVWMVRAGYTLDDVRAELGARFGRSGLSSAAGSAENP